jgi:DNA polymerase elongation subunit (family B)
MMNDDHTNEIWIDTGIKYTRCGNDLYLSTHIEGEYAQDSIPSISSTVTAHARMLLWKLIKIAGRENVLYCDTDSLFVSRSGYDNLKDWISPTELGKLKLEKSGIVEIRGCKDYTFNGEVKRKGIKKNAEKIGDGVYRQLQFLTKSSKYRNGTVDGIIVVKWIEKEVSGIYDKGIVDENGTISPFTFHDFDHATV